MTSRRQRKTWIALDLFVMAWSAAFALGFALLGELAWALANLGAFGLAGLDASRQARLLREGEWSRWRVR